jgi:bifunctional enzyme CysN/CysC
MKSSNITRVPTRVTPAERASRNGHKGGIVWLTGLSGSGKSTLAVECERLLFERGRQAMVLDGDNLRHGLNADLGFSPADRTENIRRVGEVAALFASFGTICLAAFISPYRADRDRIRRSHPQLFHEIHLDASLEVCERRDAKGLYARARRGEIAEFTGISAPYEAPEHPELVLHTGRESVDTCLSQLMEYLDHNFAVTR